MIVAIRPKGSNDTESEAGLWLSNHSKESIERIILEKLECGRQSVKQ